MSSRAHLVAISANLQHKGTAYAGDMGKYMEWEAGSWDVLALQEAAPISPGGVP